MREAWMRAALEEAEIARQQGEVPVGAVVVCGGKVIAQAHNERENACDPTAHAEILALRRAARALGRWRLTDCTLVVTLEPCPMCAGAAAMARVGEVIYGAADPQAGCAGSVYALTEDPAFGAGTPASGGLLSGECEAQLSGFFEPRRA